MKTFKNLLSSAISLIVLLFIGSACSDKVSLSPENIKNLGEIAYQIAPSTLSYTIDEKKLLEIKVLEITDYRCAEDVICVWIGEARVYFQIEDLKKKFSLCLPLLACNTEEIFYEGRTFRITLLDVTPYPNTSQPNATKTAVFKVEEI